MEDQPPTGCGCIDRVVQAPEPDLPIPKASDEINQMTQASANAIQSPHDQYILAVAQIAERARQLRTITQRAARSIDVDPLTARSLQGIDLEGLILTVR